MVAEIDIWRSAKLLVDQFGTEAPIHAAMNADKHLDAGDVEGRRVWKRILRAIDEMLSIEPSGPTH